jgi:predicted small secreted protein
MKKTLLLLPFLLGASFVVGGCRDDGVMEETGEEIDDAVEDAGDELEDIGDDIEDG